MMNQTDKARNRSATAFGSNQIIAQMEEERLPRYTSYPTAPAFSGNVGPDDYEAWLSSLSPNEPVSLYFHVPFCRAMCWYCGCTTKVVRVDNPLDEYAETLAGEIDLVARKLPGKMTAGHIHWGGGTPSILGTDRLSTLHRRIAQRFEIDPKAEQAIELDPRSISDEMATKLAALGINRVSFGVQTFDAKVQAAINRIQPYEQVATAIETVRRAGIAKVSIDLIYGLPFQTADSIVETAHQALTLSPDRISAFGYAHVPWMRRHQRLIPENTLPGAHERATQFTLMTDVLTSAGYIAVGIDHFARPNDSMALGLHGGALRRNFQGYTVDPCASILGFGASAIGTLPQGYIGNDVSTAAYSRAVKEGRLATSRGYALTDDDRIRSAIIHDIMCTGAVSVSGTAIAIGVPRAEITAIFSEALPALQSLRDAALIEWDGERLTVAPDARMFVRSVASAFDVHLSATTGRHAKAI
jgi:oxygen-independent coproporphyrinogen III oxidase